MSSLKIRFHGGGVELPGLKLWLDPHDAKKGPERVFVSHAHSDHTAAHREILVSEPTSRLMRARLSGQWLEQVLPFGETREFQNGAAPYRITLLPAGHIFGSAMSLVESEGSSLLYTGDFKLKPGLSSELCEPRPADILVMETTFGRPKYVFPDPREVMRGVIRFCREAIDNEETPVLLGYSLGKSQEILSALAEEGVPVALHPSVHKMTKIYEQLGRTFPPYEKLDGASARGKAVLCPPNLANSAVLRDLGKVRLAVLTGWAVDSGCRFRHQAHAAFPLSDHADFPDLVEMVKKVNPKKVFTLHGFAAEFAQTLRDMGFDAQALSEDEQLALPLAFAPKAPAPKPALATPPPEPAPTPTAPRPANAFVEFADICAKIGGTTKKHEKTALLAAYLAKLDSASLGIASSWFTGNPFPPSQNKVLQLGWAAVRDALRAAGKLNEADFGQIYLKHSDLGETTFEILSAGSRADPVETIESIDRLFRKLQLAHGPTGKVPPLVAQLERCSPLEGKFLIKILTGDLRIGLKEGLVEEAIAKAFGSGLEKVKQANLLLADIGETAQLALQNQLGSVTLIPFRPAKYMLASPEETAADIWNRAQGWESGRGGQAEASTALLHPNLVPPARLSVWVEDKYDGIRAQLHKVGNAVAIYSRDLKEITPGFGELASAAKAIPGDFILDGEIVAMRGDRVLPFAELQKRLGRKEDDLFLGGELPARFVAFDVLWDGQASLMDEPLRVRRERLEKLELGSLRLARVARAGSVEEIESEFAAARERGNEGLVVKDPESPYAPGRRGLAWLKLKMAYATLDCVVVGAEYGSGKRKSVLSDYTFAVRDENSGELKTIGKAHTGLTDAEIETLTRHFLLKSVSQNGRYHTVEPDVVLEIAFDLLQKSARHSSGLAMRFPRIVRIRNDKTPAEIDTVAAARKLLAPPLSA